MSPSSASERLVSKILSSRKYSSLDPDLARRVVAEALGAAPNEREASRRARAKLHQIYGAFGASVDYARIEDLVFAVESAPREPRESWMEAVRDASREILGMHASTAERLGCLEELYAAVFGLSPGEAEISRVLDVGCGLGCFAMPWMGLPPGAEYHAVDLDRRLGPSIGRYLELLGRRGAAAVTDVLSGALPPGRWDVVLLLKVLPTLERQERGASARLIRSLDAARFAISFPRASLGGRRKGMDVQYGRFVAALAARCDLEVSRVQFPTEALYLARPRATAP